MLTLSDRYAAATTDAQRSMLEAAGEGDAPLFLVWILLIARRLFESGRTT